MLHRPVESAPRTGTSKRIGWLEATGTKLNYNSQKSPPGSRRSRSSAKTHICTWSTYRIRFC